MARFDLFSAVLIHGTDSYIPASLYETIGSLREKRAVLNVVVTDEVKGAPLGKHAGVVVNGSIMEVVCETRCHAFAGDDLKEFTVPDDRS